MKKVLPVLALTMALTACGGSGGSTDIGTGTGGSTGGSAGGSTGGTDGGSTGGTDGGSTVSKYTFSIYNTYRSELLVCSDVNRDGVCGSDEEQVISNEDGQAELSKDAFDHPVLVILPTDVWLVDPITGKQSIVSDFTLVAPAFFDYASPLTTLIHDANSSATQLNWAWDVPAEIMLLDYEDLSTGMGHINEAISRFLLSQIQYGRDLEQFIDLLKPAIAQASEADRAGKDLTGLRFLLDQSGVVTTNLVADLIEQPNLAELMGTWNFFYAADTSYRYDNYSTFGTVRINSYEFCLKSVRLDGTKKLADERFENCRLFGLNENSAFVGDSTTVDNLTLVIGERTDSGVVMVFRVTDFYGKVKGHYWLDNFDQSYDVGVSFSEAQWSEQSLFKLGYETQGKVNGKGNEAYTAQYFLGGEYVITQNNVEESYQAVLGTQHGFQSGMQIGGTVLTYDLADSSSNYVMATRHGERLSLGIDAGRGVEFTLMTPNETLFNSIVDGTLYTE